MEGNLRLTLELTKEDMGQFLVEKDKAKTHIFLTLILYAIIDFLYGIMAWKFRIPVNIGTELVIISIAIVIPFFIVQKILFKKGQNNFEKMKEQFPLIELSIDSKTIYVKAGEARSKYEWKDVFALKEYGSCFCILINKRNGMMIPKRLLEDNEPQRLRELSGDKLSRRRK